MPVVKQPRGTQRYRPIQREDEDARTRAIIELASQYGRYGYRRITALLQPAGWQVGKDRVERIWRREGLKIPGSKSKRAVVAQRRIVCEAASRAPEPYLELRFPQCTDPRWQECALLNLIDEHTRECLMVRPERRWSSARVIEALADVMVIKGGSTTPSFGQRGVKPRLQV